MGEAKRFSGQYDLRQNPVTWEGTQHRFVAMVVWQSAFQKAPEPGHPLNSQNLPLFILCVGLQSTISENPRTGTTESLFTLATGTLCDNVMTQLKKKVKNLQKTNSKDLKICD